VGEQGFNCARIALDKRRQGLICLLDNGIEISCRTLHAMLPLSKEVAPSLGHSPRAGLYGVSRPSSHLTGDPTGLDTHGARYAAIKLKGHVER
jgi:hypothetical protein